MKSIRVQRSEKKIQLPVGILRGDTLYRSATVRPVTAGDRKIYGDKNLGKNPGKLITKAISTSLTSVEGLSSISEMDIRSLTAMDRDAILFEVRSVTTGGRPLTGTVTCHACGTENTLTAEEEEIRETFQQMPEEEAKNRDTAYILHTIELPDFGFTGVFRYPNGITEEMIAPKIANNMNPFEISLEFIRALCHDFNGEGQINSVDEIADLSIEFVDALQEKLSVRPYGYDLTLTAPCYDCGASLSTAANILDFLSSSLSAPRT